METDRKIWSPNRYFYQYCWAYPGVGAEERGRGELLSKPDGMSDLKVPIAIIIGEVVLEGIGSWEWRIEFGC